MRSLLNPRHMALGLVVVGLGVAAYKISIPLRASGQKRQCQSNLKQLGLAVTQYVRDYDETFVLAPKWEAELKPYLVRVTNSPVNHQLVCPTTERGYAFNVHLDSAPVSAVDVEETMTLFYEPARVVNADDGKNWALSGIHDKGSNVCFVDGHVEWLTAKPTFWTRRLADLAGAKQRRDEENRRMTAELKRKLPIKSKKGSSQEKKR